MNLDFPVIGIVAILTGLILQFLAKPLIELWIKPDAPNHDTVIRAAALLLGVGLTALDVLIGHPLPPDGNAWLLLIGSGAVSGLASIGGYHAISESATPANAVTVIPPTPLPTGAANSALILPPIPPPEPVTFSPSPLHQAAGIAGMFTANSRDNVPIPPTGAPPQSQPPEPAAPAAPPA